MKRYEIASKREVNFLNTGEKASVCLKFSAALILLTVAAVIFSEIAVSGRLERIASAEAELSSLTHELLEIKRECADLEKIKAEYDRYSYRGFDTSLRDRLEVFELLERDVFSKAEVQNAAILGKTLSITVAGLDLEKMSELIEALEADRFVESVAVSTEAVTGLNGSTVTKITVSLNEDAEVAEEGALE